MDIMIPVWAQAPQPFAAKGELTKLRGSEVALVDDNYDPVFTSWLERQLLEQHGIAVKRLLKPWASAPSPKTLIDEASQCSVALVGVAMCGSCTSGLIVDAVALEKRGVHTVTIVWDTFEKAARASARVQGLSEIALAIIPNRKGTDTDDDQRAKVDAVLPTVVDLLQVSREA